MMNDVVIRSKLIVKKVLFSFCFHCIYLDFNMFGSDTFVFMILTKLLVTPCD